MHADDGFGWAYDEEGRKRWQDPEVILTDIGLKSGATFMDIGCGEGFFTLPAARLVGEQGKVYGVDTSGQSISRLEKKADMGGLRNLNLTVGRAEEIVLCQACADIVFLGIVLHDFEEPARVLRNARKMLKPTGRLVDLDWKEEPMEFGPPLPKRFSEAEAVHLIEVAGFKVESITGSGFYHYLIIAKP